MAVSLNNSQSIKKPLDSGTIVSVDPLSHRIILKIVRFLNHEPKSESVNFIEITTLGIVGKHASKTTPRVYTRVTSILNWIKNNMK